MKLTKTFLSIFLSASILFFGCKPKDADVQTKITEQFAAKPDCAGASASVMDGVATLTGEVKDDDCRKLAETTAKEVKGVKSVVNNLTTTPPPPVVVEPTINSDGTLTKGVTDATKDFPGVTATVNNGEITLTGSIKRTDLTKLMQTLNTLKPSKINNQLTIK